ncbi:uncharacterized protein [Diabrotica undecimpunctata]|uniref:uncharacterized protein n=1 Tax=Diabrotica undecimpunctata TaxID=50387 RepID=UPI003B642832
MELLTLCTDNTYFQLDNDFYKQNFGLAMGSSLSPLLADIFIEDFEQKIVHKQDKQPIVWWRYVGVVLSIWPHGPEVFNTFLMNIHNKKESINKFTMEQESNNSLPFLDRKPIHTNKHLNYHSDHNINVKKGIIKSLYDRARSSNEKHCGKKKTC